ncbi:cytochrome P450 734A1-like [Cryptomeria japonica]|uniref:cytochrome P450 734A1-like n=1 Tax=Cryptomeria japonica TaxID=3369 RepID=UPI0027D9D32E|nr:cytochrome P450 734A1-like [Cryptomeria japonica]
MPDEFVRWSLCIFQHLFGMGTNIADPQLVQEILSVRSDDYEKIEANNALKKLEGEELLDLKGEKWAQHKRIINPAIDVLVSTHIYELYMCLNIFVQFILIAV